MSAHLANALPQCDLCPEPQSRRLRHNDCYGKWSALLQDEAAALDKERSRMKQLLSPLTALVLVATGYSLHAAGWLNHATPPRAEIRRTTSDPYASEAAFRHRTNQPNHWRAMVMQK